jgi:hypothetical protein
VAAARRFSEELAVAFDLHRLQLWDALSLERPPNLLAERQAGGDLCDILAGETGIDDEMYEQYIYQLPSGPTSRPSGS